MTEFRFEKATKKRARLRMALDGPSGCGKTYTGLIFATALADGGQIAVIDTERGSASKYADLFEFDVLELSNYHPKRYIEAIEAAEAAGYDVLLIDSLSHAWEGESGVLDLHDKAMTAQRVSNSFTAWKDVTPLQRQLVDKILQSSCHIIATMRTKTEWVLETDSRGKAIPKRVGMKAVQRQGIEYEFDIVGDMDVDHNLIISKTRCHALSADTSVVCKEPDSKWFQVVADWLSDGSPEPERMRTQAPEPHWIDGENMRKRFWQWAREELALTDAQVYDALGVAHVHDFNGTPQEAKNLITSWIATQSVATTIIPAPEPGENPFDQEVTP
ncbi:MAG: ATP-binding protein [Phycisphaerae bacterium]